MARKAVRNVDRTDQIKPSEEKEIDSCDFTVTAFTVPTPNHAKRNRLASLETWIFRPNFFKVARSKKNWPFNEKRSFVTC